MSLRSTVFAGTAIIAAACASPAGSNARRAACDLSSRDSVFVVRGPVYRDCDVEHAARLLTPAVRPDFRPTATRSACYSADLEFVVDSTGKPETETAFVVRTNDQGFAESVLATLNAWRYEPALRGQRPVRQIVTAHQGLAVQMLNVMVPAGSPPPTAPPPQSQPSC